MPTVADFRYALRFSDPSDIIGQFFLDGGAAMLSGSDIAHIGETLALRYGVNCQDVRIVIVGSAKLGFSIVQKRKRGQLPLPRYRAFSAESDIDVAVIAPEIFNLVWHELSSHSHNAAKFPWRADRLGDYLICGWLRPDHFPKGVRLLRCDSWFDTFKQLSAQTRFNRHPVRGGLFQSEAHLRQYLSRAIQECIVEEITP